MSEETLVVRARDLRKDLTEFEQTLPEKSNSGNETLNGLLGMKHLLFEQFKARAEKQQIWHAILSKKWGGYWGWFWDRENIHYSSDSEDLFFLRFIGGGLMGINGIIALASWAIQATLKTSFFPIYTPLAVLYNVLLFGGFPLIASALSYPAQRAKLKAQPEEERARLNEDPVFLITSAQEYIGEAVKVFHSRLSEIKAAFERAVIHPRLEADKLLGKLHGKRAVVKETADEKLPDKAVILREIDQHLRECEVILGNKHPEEERVITLLEKAQAQILALHEYTKRLEAARQVFLSQASLLEELRGMGVRIQELQGYHSLAIQTLVSELRDLRTDIGVALVTMSQFQTYLEQDPRIGELSSRASSTELTSARALAGQP